MIVSTIAVQSSWISMSTARTWVRLTVEHPSGELAARVAAWAIVLRPMEPAAPISGTLTRASVTPRRRIPHLPGYVNSCRPNLEW